MPTFTMIYDSIMTDHRLNSDQKLAYSSLLRRLSLSKQNPTRFYSKRYNDYFVLFSQAELAQLLGVSLRTISTALSKLEQLGLIIRKHRFNASDCIFLPESAKFAHSQTQNLQPKDNYAEKQRDLQSNNNVNNHASKFSRWVGATYQKMGLSKKVLETIGKVNQRDIAACFDMVQLINNAKKHVLSTYGLVRDAFKYETMECLDEPLAEKISLVCELAPNEKSAKNKYLTTSLIRFFIDQFGLNPRNYLSLKRKKKPEPKIDPSFPIPSFKIL